MARGRERWPTPLGPARPHGDRHLLGDLVPSLSRGDARVRPSRYARSGAARRRRRPARGRREGPRVLRPSVTPHDRARHRPRRGGQPQLRCSEPADELLREHGWRHPRRRARRADDPRGDRRRYREGQDVSRAITLGLAIALLALACSGPQLAGTGLSPTPAPEFTLTDVIGGESLSLS